MGRWPYWSGPVNAGELRERGRRAAPTARSLCGAAEDGADEDNPALLLVPEVHDQSVSKLVLAVTGGFGRRSDREFIKGLVDDGHIEPTYSMAGLLCSRCPNGSAKRHTGSCLG